MDLVDSVLLDTTIQLYRVAYGPEMKRDIDRELTSKQVYSSSFVFREFLRTIIADLIWVHGQASTKLTAENDGKVGLDQLSRYIALGENVYSKRSIQRMHLVIARVLASFPATRVPRNKLLRRLERTIEEWVRDFFRIQVGSSLEIHSVECLRTLDDRPGELEELCCCDPFPPSPKFPRAAAQFLERSSVHVKQVEREMQSAKAKDGRDTHLLRVLGWLKGADGEYDFVDKLQVSKRWNWALGDLLIALETPSEVALYSTDRAFAILCKALGKVRYDGGAIRARR